MATVVMMPVNHIGDVLTEQQKRVMARVLAQEEAHREHVVVYLSGAHAYGFPSPDSDLDLKAIHVAKTADLLGLTVPAPTFDRVEVVDGVEVDYTSNELAHVLSGMLAGNGNFLERVLGRTVAYASGLLAELRPIVQRSLSRRVHRHYRGCALNQLQFLEREPTAKKLETGELEPDLTRLMARDDVADAAEQVERKLRSESSATTAPRRAGQERPD